jgi:outer membrane lipoprotein-sorting protein
MATPIKTSPIRVAVVALCASLFLAGCFTGQRPSFEPTQPSIEPTGNPNIDAVLERLESVSTAVFTADYSILTKLGNVTSTARVVQSAPDRRSITINNVRFIYDGASVATCNLLTAECEATINDARVSDVSVTHEFYGKSFAQRLRVDASRRVGDPAGYSITQAGQQALCVDVPVTGGTVSYCALSNGVLARYDGNDLFIEMTAYSDFPDETAFETSLPETTVPGG